MQRDTKFNYGFLLAGIGVPSLVGLLGPLWGVVVAILFCVGAVFLLSAGHTHREEGAPSPTRGPLAKAAIYGLFGALVAGGALGIRLAIKGSHQVEQGMVEPAKEPATKPDTSLSSRPKSEPVEQNKGAQSVVRPPSGHTSQRKPEGSRTEPKPKEPDSFLQSLTTEELHSLGKNRLMALMKARQAIEDWKISMDDRMSMATGEDHDFLLKKAQQGPPQKLRDACKQAVADYRAVRTLILEKSGPNEDTQEILRETGNARCE